MGFSYKGHSARENSSHESKMILLCALCIGLSIPISVYTQDVAPPKIVDTLNVKKYTHSSETALNWISDTILEVITSLIPNEQPSDGVEGRVRKRMRFNKFLLPLLIGFLLIKSLLLPITLKALAVLSGKAVVLSTMSLILAAIVGLRAAAQPNLANNNNNNNNPNNFGQVRSDSDLAQQLPLRYRLRDIVDYDDDLPYRYRDRHKRK